MGEKKTSDEDDAAPSESKQLWNLKSQERTSWEKRVSSSDPNQICPNALALHASYREKVTHEDGLVNTRTSWLLISQSIFFAALVFWLEKFPSYPGFWLVAFAIVIAGLVSCAATFVSVQAAFNAIDEAQTRWNFVRKKIDNYMVLPTVAGNWQGDSGVAFGKYSAHAISFVLFLAWVTTGAVLYYYGAPKQTEKEVGRVHISQDKTNYPDQVGSE